MAERRMLLNSAESFVGTMRIGYNYDGGKLPLTLNDNIKIIEEYYDGYSAGHYIIGFKKDLIVPENFINPSDYGEIDLCSDYNIIFDTRSIYVEYLSFYGNFTFNEQSIISGYIELNDYEYTFNDNCFDVDINGSIRFFGKTIPQYYKNINNYEIWAYPHILYDLMKYNNIEEGDEKAKKYHTLNNHKLFISSPTEYNGKIQAVDLGDNNHINSINKFIYDENYIIEYVCGSNITHLRKGISFTQDSTVYFPDTVTDIDFDTFEDEINLNKVIIFGNCKLTYLTGFYNSGLKNIEIYSDKIETIKEYCFESTILNTINMPKSVKYIEDEAFSNIDSEFVINYNGTINEWSSINFDSYWMGNMQEITVICTDGVIIETPNTPRANEIYYTSTDGNIINVNTRSLDNELLSNTYEGKGKLVFKNAVDNVRSLFVDNTQLTAVWLPNYNIISTFNVFNFCTNLIQVNNSKQLKHIESGTFKDCINLQQIIIDSNVICDDAFRYCRSLNYVNISKKVESIKDYAFANCTSLESIDYEGTIEEWNNIEIASDWRDGSAIKTIHCSDGDIQL